MNVSGTQEGKNVTQTKTVPGTSSAADINIRFDSHRRCSSELMKALMRNTVAWTSLTAIQNWVDLLEVLGVTKAGMAALLRVCRKSMSPMARKPALRKSECLSFVWSYVYQPIPNMESETIMLKNSAMLWKTDVRGGGHYEV